MHLELDNLCMHVYMHTCMFIDCNKVTKIIRITFKKIRVMQISEKYNREIITKVAKIDV